MTSEQTIPIVEPEDWQPKEITAWAYAMFGPDCHPVIEDRAGDPYLCVINPTTKRRYALQITETLIRDDKPGKIMFDGAVH